MIKKEPHMIDMGEPDSTWKGYWCPVDQQFHKDGTTVLMNSHCIVCKVMLTRRYPARKGRQGFTVNG